jgi:uncharacterized membrane protein YccC
MDTETTIQFLLEQQAAFEARFGRFERSLEEIRELQRGTERLIHLFAQAGAEQIELHRQRLDTIERHQAEDRERFDRFLERFDAYVRGLQGDGHGSRAGD